MTEKLRPRVITGWRQVTRRPGVAKPRTPLLAPHKKQPQPRVPVTDGAAKERWEAEGGHLAIPAK